MRLAKLLGEAVALGIGLAAIYGVSWIIGPLK